MNIISKLAAFMEANPYRREPLQWITIILAGVCIIALPGFTKVAKYSFSLLSIISIVYAVRNFHFLHKLTKHEKRFFILIVLGFLWTLVTLYINGSPGNGNNQVWSRQFFLVMLVPLYFLFLSVNISQNTIFWILVLAATVTCFVSVYDTFYNLELERRRATGGTNPILFGSMALCLAAFVVAIVIYSKKNFRIQLFGWFSIAMLFVGVILSGSRGVWLAIPLLVVMGLNFAFPHMTNKRKTILIVLSLLIVSMSYFVPKVKDRIDVTVIEMQSYLKSESTKDEVRYTSLGIRFEMWKAGIKMFLDSPVFGVGMGGYLEAASQNLERYNVSQSALHFYHPHNQYVSALATKGILGLVFLLCTLGYPVFLLLSVGKDSNVNRCYVFVGLFVALSYVIFSITDVPLEGKPLIIFYVIVMAFVLANVRKSMSAENELVLT